MNVYISLGFLSVMLAMTDSVATQAGAARLLADLFSGYEKLLQPGEGGEAVDVQLGISLQSIIAMESTHPMEAIFTLNVWLNLNWQDERLRWDATEYDGVDSLSLPPGLFWLPDIKLYNGIEPTELFNPGYNVVLYSDGFMSFIPVANIKVQCGRASDDETWRCMPKFGSWTRSGDDINLALISDTVDLSTFESRAWELVNANAQRNALKYDCCLETYIDIVFTIDLRLKED